MGKYLNAVKKNTCNRLDHPLTKLTEPPENSFGSFGSAYPKRLRENILSLDEKSFPHTLDELAQKHAGVELTKLTEPSNGDCDHCPACGTWAYREYAGKRLCFHRAYFLAKAGNPVDIEIQRRNCPKTSDTRNH